MVYVSKGRSFTWCKPQDCATYRRGVMLMVHLVVDNWPESCQIVEQDSSGVSLCPLTASLILASKLA